MKINSIDKTSFEKNIKTDKILEAAVVKNITSEGIDGFKYLVNELNPLQKQGKLAVGNKGYRHYAEEIGKKITEKYPQIAEAANSIKEFLKINPKAKKEELREFIKPIIKALGEEVDIVI